MAEEKRETHNEAQIEAAKELIRAYIDSASWVCRQIEDATNALHGVLSLLDDLDVSKEIADAAMMRYLRGEE